MVDPQGLSSITADAPIEWHDATALMVRVKLESAALLLVMAKIPVASQEYHNDTYFHDQFQH
jgi:hypothetical protein